MTSYYRPYQTAESRLKDTVFLVEATFNETHQLWADFAKESRSRIIPEHPGLEWRQVTPGWMVEVGQLAGMPVCVMLNWNEIDGALVCFWSPTSLVIDHRLIQAWFKEHYSATWDGGTRSASCDSSNFHHCLDAIKERKEAVA